ncbi:MAG: TIGR02452 family protein [Moorea sp. SIO2B7]|nr:TIGR02452 family protein [Moorena sp. SIO2B7]
MVSRKSRANIAKETLEILERGYYFNSFGETVAIKNLLNFAKENSIHYKPDDFKLVFSKRDSLLKENNLKNQPIFEVTHETTLEAAKRIVIDEGQNNVLCLNFASAKNPGGGFLNGSKAQEESLARSSGMFPCIFKMKDMYEANLNFNSCLYTDNMIYSPKVPFFRNDEGELLNAPYTVSIITSPAVNRGAVEKNEPHNISRIKEVMLSRMEKLLSLAVIHEHKTLILGAWGCGVFRNKADEVAECFGEHLLDNKVFRYVFERVIFAVHDSSKDKHVLEAFRDRFNKIESQEGF